MKPSLTIGIEEEYQTIDPETVSYTHLTLPTTERV